MKTRDVPGRGRSTRRDPRKLQESTGPRSGDRRQLIATLKERDSLQRRLALESLSQTADPRALGDLRKLVKHRDWEVRIAATEALGNVLRNSRVRCTELLERLSDPVVVVRIQAIEALESIGGTSALPGLRSSLAARDPTVRSYAAAAIGSLGTARDLNRLERVLRKERSTAARIGQYAGIFVLGGRWAIDGLIGLLHDPDYRVRCATAESLVRTVAHRANAARIYNALETALSVEKTVAAREVLEDGLARLASRYELESEHRPRQVH